MKQTTLCYLEQDGKYLMLHRVKKAHDEIMTNGSASAENLRIRKVRRTVCAARCLKRPA